VTSRLARIVVASAGLTLTCLAWPVNAERESQGGAATIAVDTATTYQTIDHFGSSHRVFDDPHVWNHGADPSGRSLIVMPRADEDRVFDRLYRDGGLTYMRISTDGGLEPSRGVFNYDGRRLDAQIDDALRAKARGPVKVAYTQLRYPPEPWMTDRVSDYADYFVAVVRRAQVKGLRIDYLTFNEPRIEPATMREVVKAVSARVPDSIRWVLPEVIRPGGSLEVLEFLMADPAVRSVTAAAATHLYADEQPVPWMARLKAAADRHGLPLWMTEYSTLDPWQWASLQHSLLVTSGVGAIDYMWGFFGAWDGAQLIVGGVDANGRYLGAQPRKQFAIMGQWSRFVSPGSRRVAATSDDAELLVSAFASPSDTVLVVYNPTRIAKSVSVGMPGSTVARARTSPTEDVAALPGAMLTNGRFTTTLPASSITTFTASASESASRK
jgi:O-glycosyl hydrolase